MDKQDGAGAGGPRSEVQRLRSEVDRLGRELEVVRCLRQQRGTDAQSEIQLIFDNTVVGIVYARHRVIERVNRRFAEMIGYAPNELAGQSTLICYADPADYERVGREGYPVLSAGEDYQTEVRFRRRDGTAFWVRLSGRAIRPGDPETDSIWVFEDVSERKAAEDRVRGAIEALRRSEEYFRCIIENGSDVISVIDRRGVVRYDNPAIERVLGYRPQERIGRQTLEIVHPDDRPAVRDLISRIELHYPERVTAEARVRDKSGEWRTLEFSAVRALDPDGDVVAIVTSRDVTERREIEARLRRVNRTLSLLRLGNELLVRAQNESALTHEICALMANEGGYQLAWIGYVQNDPIGTVKPVAWNGPASGYMDGLQVVRDESGRGAGIGGTALRNGASVCEPDLQAATESRPWLADAAPHGIRSAIALPLKNGGPAFGLLCIYAGHAGAFDHEDISLFEELAGDLSYGIAALRTRAKLDKSLEDAVQAIAAAAELRDAYTAGHQRRVSDLAVAIAREMGLADDRILGLHVAGVVHDIGKINIPAEILAKPARLSATEYALIKGHPDAGYGILKGIDFPWPVADIVRQHHEALDGSGYPQGLRGEAILPEARILSVADVVEAMASHRPYRPGLGIDAALDEIAKQRGVKFDPQAVDACIKLFREDGYQLK